MATLLLVACLAGDCRDYRIATDLPLISCLVTAPQALAQWSKDHPGYEIKRFGCSL